jgi:glycosyltransferase involved in cell wall biosynthesis
MKTPPMVSVIIPSYNREKLLGRAIDSVIGQIYQNWELIIVDDGSTDKTEELVSGYTGKDSRIRYIKNIHPKGIGGARNYGVETAQGEYIAFLDSDDEWKEYHLRDTIEEFLKNPEVDWVYSDMELWKDDKVFAESFIRRTWHAKKRFKTIKVNELLILDDNDLLDKALKYGFYTSLPTSVVRKKLFDVIRFTESRDLIGVEDLLLFLEAIVGGFRLAYMKEAHLKYYIHQENISLCNPAASIDDKLNVYKKLDVLYSSILPQKMPLTKRRKEIIKNNIADIYFWGMGYNCYLRSGDYHKAKEHFLKAIRLNPLNWKYWKTYLIRTAFNR